VFKPSCYRFWKHDTLSIKGLYMRNSFRWPIPCCVAAAIVYACLSPAIAQAPRPPAIVSVCTPCHGIGGTGGDVEKPNLAGQKSIYIRKQLMAFRSGKRKHPDMQKIARGLTDREINQLVMYYSTLVPP
jgi:cytochrome c553